MTIRRLSTISMVAYPAFQMGMRMPGPHDACQLLPHGNQVAEGSEEVTLYHHRHDCGWDGHRFAQGTTRCKGFVGEVSRLAQNYSTG